jgi:phosphoglycerate dehydrogenase-like enzyme
VVCRGFGRGSYQFTNGSGPHAIPIGEFVLAEMLMFAKDMPRILRNQRAKKWDRVGGNELYGSTVGIIGLGDIGMSLAERAQAMGCRVLATRRSIETAQGKSGPVDELLPPSETNYLLQESDYVVVAAPLTPETRHMINAETLRLMKPTAFLFNIARGGLVDEPALIEALKSGVIAGAALDVFEQEPLPAESPLWEMENVIITPHISPTSGSGVFMRRHVELFTENLRRYLANKPLMNVVDVERGY